MALPASDDISGRIFGAFKVLRKSSFHEPRNRWFCECVHCKKGIDVDYYVLVNRKIASCGCLEAKEARKKRKARLEAKLVREREKESSNRVGRLKVKRTIKANVSKIRKAAMKVGLTDEQITECFLGALEEARRVSAKWNPDLINPVQVAKAVDKPGGATMAEIMDFINLPQKNRNLRHTLQIASVLRTCGFKRWRVRRGLDAAGKRRYVPGWIGAEEAAEAEP